MSGRDQEKIPTRKNYRSFPRTGTEWWREDAANVHLHNALWASAVSTAAGGPAHWWWNEFDDHDAYTELLPVRRFVDRLPAAKRAVIGNGFRVGIVLGFVRRPGTTRAEGLHGGTRAESQTKSS